MQVAQHAVDRKDIAALANTNSFSNTNSLNNKTE
jgi:hypothetical protein